MPRTLILQILVQETIVAVWIPRVKQNSKVSFRITNEVRHYWSLQIIIFQMLHLLTNQMLWRNLLQVHNLSLINNHLELKNTGREISTVLPWVVKLVRFLEPVLPTQTCKFYLKKVKKANSMPVPTCSSPIIKYPTLKAEVKIKKQIINNLKKGAKHRLKTLLCYKTDQ